MTKGGPMKKGTHRKRNGEKKIRSSPMSSRSRSKMTRNMTKYKEKRRSAESYLEQRKRMKGEGLPVAGKGENDFSPEKERKGLLEKRL